MILRGKFLVLALLTYGLISCEKEPETVTYTFSGNVLETEYSCHMPDSVFTDTSYSNPKKSLTLYKDDGLDMFYMLEEDPNIGTVKVYSNGGYNGGYHYDPGSPSYGERWHSYSYMIYGEDSIHFYEYWCSFQYGTYEYTYLDGMLYLEE